MTVTVLPLLPPLPSLDQKPKEGTFTPDFEYQKAAQVKRSDRDEGLAVDIMKLAVDFHKGSGVQDTQLVDTCERLWRWATGETHKLPEDNGAP